MRQELREPIDFDLDAILTDKFDIEHIWANNPDVIPTGLEQVHDENKNRLGNLTIASASWDRSWGNHPLAKRVCTTRNRYLGFKKNFQGTTPGERRK